MATRLLSTQRIVNLASDPETGSAGELYYNTVSNVFKYYNGVAWVEITGAGEGASLTISETAPISAGPGDLWLNSSTLELFIYYDSFWVEIGGGANGTNSFQIIDVPNGTNPESDSASDTLTFTQSNGMIITGNSSTDTVEFSTNATSLNTASTIVARDADQAFDITAIDFDTTDSIAASVGRLTWDDGEGTLSLGLKGGNVNLQLGQENITLCYNGTGSTITNGSVVYVVGAQGQRPSVALADADGESTSSKVLGVATENIANGAEGFVATFGIVNGINTSGFTAGDALWLSSTAGQFTNVKPNSPTHLVFIGYCLKVNSSSGRIFINPQNGYEIEELHDVLISSVSDKDILLYNASTSLWENTSLPDIIEQEQILNIAGAW